MKPKTLIKSGVIHFSVLTILLFLRFSNKENGDMNVVILGTLIYLPYLIGLTVLNLGLLSTGLIYFKDKFKPFAVVLTSLILVTWYFVSGKHLQIYHWKLTEAEFWYLNLVILLLNARSVMLLMKQQKNEQRSGQDANRF